MLKKVNKYNLVLLLLFLSACHTPPIPKKIIHEFQMNKNGVDFTPVLGCIGNKKSKTINSTYDRRRRLTGYTYIVSCGGKSYTLSFSEIQYDGKKRVGYREEMTCENPQEHHVVIYKDIKYNNDGNLVRYTAVLDGVEKKYTTQEHK